MLRALWFMFKVGVLIAAAVWVANRPGVVQVSWLGYDITIQLGFALLFLFIFLLVVLLGYKMLLGAFGFRKFLKQRRARKREKKGWQSFAKGLSAAAAGDAKNAAYHAEKMKLFLPYGGDQGLSAIIEAQAARMQGDHDTARLAYGKLSGNKDTALLGLRGLVVMAAEQGDIRTALSYLQKAPVKQRKLPWFLKARYALELKDGQWHNAAITLKTGQKEKIFLPEPALSDQVALLLQQAEEAQLENKKSVAEHLMRKAHRLDAAHVPAALRLASFYLAKGRRRKAVTVIKETWAHMPHPELAQLWGDAAPRACFKDTAKRLAWYEKLVALKPDHIEGQLAIAAIAIDDRLWGEARQYLGRAEQIMPSARLYRLRARLEEYAGNVETAQEMLKKAADAESDKVWTCRETGRVYDKWSPVAHPHGAFNTIVWGYPDGNKTENALMGGASGSESLLCGQPAIAGTTFLP